MTRLSFDPAGLQFAWDQTSIKLALECPRKYKYKILDRWTPYSPSAHLIFGMHYATALEHYHKFRAAGEDHLPAVRAVVRETLEATWVRGADGTGFPWDSLDHIKTRENLIRTIVWYLEEFEHDVFKTVILSDGTPAVEYSFALPVDDDIILTGHIDRLVTYHDDYIVTDNKTTGSTISPRYFRGYDLDIQMDQYTFGGKMIYNLPVKGVAIDAAQIAVGFSRFERGFTFRSDDQLNEWYDETMHIIDVTRSRTEENRFPRNRTACGNYGGCEFASVCSAPKEIRQQQLKAEFYQGPGWDPLASR